MAKCDENESRPRDTPGCIFSILDTDLYKLTMQCAIFKLMPNVEVTYAFTNRTPTMRLNRRAFRWLAMQIQRLDDIHITSDELDYLRRTCPYLDDEYLKFIRSFRFDPSMQVNVKFHPDNEADTEDDETLGDISYDVHGKWLHTILYEVPLLALTSEAYFRFMDQDWSYEGQYEKALSKGQRLMQAGCNFSEFGTRRRRDYHTHDHVLRGLVEASRHGANERWPGQLMGTSNVHFAMKYGIPPIGTVAHEWVMGIAAYKEDYQHANELALRYWVECFGKGVLGIALTDTFGTEDFLKSFGKPMSSLDNINETVAGNETDGAGLDSGLPRYADIFTGVRQDSGNPLHFIRTMRQFYKQHNINAGKTIVFSDSLNVDRCIKYKTATDEAGLAASFGIGTFLTNDFDRLSTGKSSPPMNIVIKLASVNGIPAVKISDDAGKNSGDARTVEQVKADLGYIERHWEAGGNEAHRW